MSYRAPRDESGFFFRIPHDLPIVVSGRPVQDLDLESRVNKALLAEYDNNSSWKKHKPEQRGGSGWGWGWGWWDAVGVASIRSFFCEILRFCGTFSLGYYFATHRGLER